MDTKVIVIGGSIVAVTALIILWQVRKDAITVGAKAVQGAQAAASAVNPINHDNIFSSALNSVGGALTMDSNFSFGGGLYDTLHPTATTP